MFRLWYLAFTGKPREEVAHQHATPWSMLVPLVVLALLSFCAGWIGIERFSRFLAPSVGARSVEAGSANLDFYLSAAAVSFALLGLVLADWFYRRKPARPAQLAAALPVGYRLLANKYFVDEFYAAAVVKPLIFCSRYLLGTLVDTALLGGAVWLLGGMAKFSGALLQQWQSGNLRSYAAWLAAGAAAVLLFMVVPWPAVLANLSTIHIGVAGH
jgi:NADH-quinone oxidoreductase subunit L